MSEPSQNHFKRWVKFFASVKMAVVLLLLLATAIAIGTIVEAKYDAHTAQNLVYYTWWMGSLLGVLGITLVAVIVDRYPWKTKHLAFIFAHTGIILLLLGAVLTALFGLDGSMRFPLGQSNRFVTTRDTELILYSSFGGDKFTLTYQKDVNFFHLNPKKDPIVIPTLEGPIKVIDYMQFALGQRQIVASDQSTAGAALRFQVEGSRAKAVEWLISRRQGDPASFSMGLAEFVLGSPPAATEPIPSQNIVYFYPTDAGHLNYKLYYKAPDRKPISGRVAIGESVKTGWMDLSIRILQFLPNAREKWEFRQLEHPTPLTTEAIQIEYGTNKEWVQVGDILKLTGDKSMNILSFANKKVDLGFELKLDHFEISRYPGTMRAAAYESHVQVPGDDKPTRISMNEPLKYQGLTFYQASFEDDPKTGQPVASILSVNQDPGRFLKYFGSFIMSIGIALLFYFKKKANTPQ